MGGFANVFLKFEQYSFSYIYGILSKIIGIDFKITFQKLNSQAPKRLSGLILSCSIQTKHLLYKH